MAFNCIAASRVDRGYLREVSPRTRVFALVTLAALAASGVVVIGVLAFIGYGLYVHMNNAPPGATPDYIKKQMLPEIAPATGSAVTAQLCTNSAANEASSRITALLSR